MSVLSPPLISYAEVTSNLPCRRELWEAKSASKWKNVYLAHAEEDNKRSQPRTSLLDESRQIFSCKNAIDLDMTMLLMTAAVWPRLWQYREMVTATKLSNQQGLRHHESLVVNS